MRTATVLVLLSACGSSDAPLRSPAPKGSADLDPRFVDTIRAVAPAYKQWGRVDDQLNVAPTACKAPPSPGDGGRIRMSNAADAPHDQKLYYLWSNNRDLYRNTGPITPGFAIVKESFHARPVAADEPAPGWSSPIDRIDAGGKLIATGAPAGLFVMTKVDARDGTDAGWVYGTIVDGTVTSAGRVASCMGCHEASATRERLFGLK
jgi:hypothetical protein